VKLNKAWVRTLRAAPAVFAILLLSACAPAPAATPAPMALTIAGSTSAAPLLNDLVTAFQLQNPNVLVTVRGGGTGGGLAELRSGRVDLAALSWVGEGQSTPEGIQLTPLARDAIVVIVHPTNPITNLTSLQLRALYRGETLDWTVLGGLAGEPEIISREEGSGTRAAFEALAMDNDRVTLNARVMPTSETVVAHVSSEPLAIGYVTLASVDERVSAVPLEGVPPSLDSARAGDAFLTRLLYLAAPSRPSQAASAFIAFATSRQAQPTIAQRYVPVR
jgi:phosphate transport system substrate-binding protein